MSQNSVLRRALGEFDIVLGEDARIPGKPFWVWLCDSHLHFSTEPFIAQDCAEIWQFAGGRGNADIMAARVALGEIARLHLIGRGELSGQANDIVDEIASNSFVSGHPPRFDPMYQLLY